MTNGNVCYEVYCVALKNRNEMHKNNDSEHDLKNL